MIAPNYHDRYKEGIQGEEPPVISVVDITTDITGNNLDY